MVCQTTAPMSAGSHERSWVTSLTWVRAVQTVRTLVWFGETA